MTENTTQEIFYQDLFDEITSNLPEKEEILQAIEDGVERAMWQMITNATSMPCQDFYDTIKEAAEKSFSGIVIDIKQQESQ